MTEPCEINIKISVDKTELDALEAQLTRIKGLSANGNGSAKFHIKARTAVKPEIGFTSDVFKIFDGQTFIRSAYIESAKSLMEKQHAEINRLDVALNKVNVTGRGKPEFEITTEQKLAELEANITQLQAAYIRLENQAVTSPDRTNVRKMVADEIARQTHEGGSLHYARFNWIMSDEKA